MIAIISGISGFMLGYVIGFLRGCWSYPEQLLKDLDPVDEI